MSPSAKRGTVSVDSIAEEFFVRTHVNNEHVNYLAGLYEAGHHLPPIIVTRQGNILIEGRHRLAALKRLGKKAVDVEWTEETDRGKLLSLALSSNIGGALPPSNSDIVYAMSQMIEAGMTQSVIIKNFSTSWPPAVIRKYLQDAYSMLTKERVNRAKHDVIEGNMSVGEAAMLHKLKPDTLKNAMAGPRKKRTNAAEIKGTLTLIFKKRGSAMGALLKKVFMQYEDGDISWKAVEQILDHVEQCAKSTTLSTRDWRRRFEAKAGKIEVKQAS